MKRCTACQSAYPTHYTHCPRDGAPLAEASDWSEGTLVRGKYQILAKVGQGGMGAVYKALHVRFKELRALKVISPELASDATFVRRFEQEAIITRKLQHPNAVRVEDIDEAEDGRPFIVMEYIEGRSLKDVIEQEAPMAVPRVCSIVKQVAAALDAAHTLGLVHRDIKPANIALVRSVFSPNVILSGAGSSRSDEPAESKDPYSRSHASPVPVHSSVYEHVKVLDFGIAKLKEAHLEGSQALHLSHLTLTGTGVVIGTPAYMSPEQAKGMRGDQLDGRSDLYSVGIVMYQMLTGELPLKADSTLELLMAHVSTPPKPIQEARPDLQIPEVEAAVVMRCLEKNRELRPRSGQAVIDALSQAERPGLRFPAGTSPTTPRPPVASALRPDAPELRTRPTAPAESRALLRSRAWLWIALFTIAGLSSVWYLRRDWHQSIQEDRPPSSVSKADSKPSPGAAAEVPTPSPNASPKAPVTDSTPQTQPTVPQKLAPAAQAATSSSDLSGDALSRQGVTYPNGRSLNCDEALKKIKAAADKNNHGAMFMLGKEYETGHCVARDLPTAYKWFALSLRGADLSGASQAIAQDLGAVWARMTLPERRRALKMIGINDPAFADLKVPIREGAAVAALAAPNAGESSGDTSVQVVAPQISTLTVEAHMQDPLGVGPRLSGALVWVDGELRAYTGADGTATVPGLRAGQHHLKLGFPESQDHEQDVFLTAGMNSKLLILLEPLPRPTTARDIPCNVFEVLHPHGVFGRHGALGNLKVCSNKLEFTEHGSRADPRHDFDVPCSEVLHAKMGSGTWLDSRWFSLKLRSSSYDFTGGSDEYGDEAASRAVVDAIVKACSPR